MAHLDSDIERADFEQTAPIMTADYWDLVDAVRNPDPDRAAIRESFASVAGELTVKAETNPAYRPQFLHTARIMQQELDQVI